MANGEIPLLTNGKDKLRLAYEWQGIYFCSPNFICRQNSFLNAVTRHCGTTKSVAAFSISKGSINIANMVLNEIAPKRSNSQIRFCENLICVVVQTLLSTRSSLLTTNFEKIHITEGVSGYFKNVFFCGLSR